MPQRKRKWTVLEKGFAHLEMWRPYTVIWVGLVGVIGAVLANGGPPALDISFIVFSVTIFGWIGGLYLSDILDRKLDEIQKHHRPIPSGRVSPLEALITGILFAMVGIVLIIWRLTVNNLVVAVIVAILVFIYAFFSKSHGLFGHLNRGLMTVVAFIFGVVCIDQSLSNIPEYVWLMAVVFFIHDTNSNMVGAIRDMEGDRKGGYLTFPARYGLKASFVLALIMTGVWWTLTILLVSYYSFMSGWFFAGLVAESIVLVGLYWYFFKSLPCYSRSRGLRFHEFFVIERILFASALLMGLIDVILAISIGVVSLTTTIIAQKKLRAHYEFADSGDDPEC